MNFSVSRSSLFALESAFLRRKFDTHAEIGIKLTVRTPGLMTCNPFIQYVGRLEMASQEPKEFGFFPRNGHPTFKYLKVLIIHPQIRAPDNFSE